jgi:tryptophan-rich sensory protein
MSIWLSFIAVNLLAASSGAIFKPGPWYESLQKPVWCPPNWLFAPAWMVLFLINAWAGVRVFEAAAPEAVVGLMTLYGISLVLNAGWSAFFFGAKRPDWALAELVFLWLSIFAQILLFAPVDQTASFLLMPYLAWVSFAGVLNFSMWRLNRTRIVADSAL